MSNPRDDLAGWAESTESSGCVIVSVWRGVGQLLVTVGRWLHFARIRPSLWSLENRKDFVDPYSLASGNVRNSTT
jgi:hypothetical protein